jgi:hypothetical protein
MRAREVAAKMGIYSGIEALCVPDRHVTTLHDLFGRESFDQLPESESGVVESGDAASSVLMSSSPPDRHRGEH